MVFFFFAACVLITQNVARESIFHCLLTDQVIQMVIMSGTATVLQQFVSGLKSRNEDTRAKSAKDLQHYVTTELREVTAKRHMDVVEICHEDILPIHCILTECCCLQEL